MGKTKWRPGWLHSPVSTLLFALAKDSILLQLESMDMNPQRSGRVLSSPLDCQQLPWCTTMLTTSCPSTQRGMSLQPTLILESDNGNSHGVMATNPFSTTPTTTLYPRATKRAARHCMEDTTELLTWWQT